jgi:hypothetical protein
MSGLSMEDFGIKALEAYLGQVLNMIRQSGGDEKKEASPPTESRS